MIKVMLFVGLLGLVISSKAQTVGDTIPVFNLTTTANQPFQLDTTLNKVTILLFWATWNPASMELLQELKEQYSFINPIKRGERVLNIDVIDMSIDMDEKLLALNLKRENLPWNTHLADYKGWESVVLNQLKISKVPTLLILNEQRKVMVADPEPKQLRSILSNLKMNNQLSN